MNLNGYREYRAKRFPRTDIYGITSEQHSLGRSNVEVVGEMIKAGIKIIQYREKEKSKKDILAECTEIRRLTKKSGVSFFVNDHVDVAILCGADGIHVGQDDLPIERVRELAGEKMLIGLSTHSPEQADDACRRGADYIGVGPLFQTNTKKDVCSPVGFGYLDYAVSNVSVPFVAIGGIKTHNIGEVFAHGAPCAALVTEIVGAPDIGVKIQSIRDAIYSGNNRKSL